MKLLKKNIWTLFFLIFFIFTLFFIIISYSQWKEINKDFRVQNENFTKIISTSTKNYFSQLDMILELLGKKLIENDNYKNKEKSKKLFRKMLALNDSIIAYALISPEGKYLITHLDEPAENIPGVLTREAAKKSFLETLKTSKTKVGRTYKLTRTKKLAIPVRKTFFDKNGKPLAVMSIAIDAENTNFLEKELLDKDTKIINLLREEDRYRQLYIHKQKEDYLAKAYTQPLSKEAYNYAIKQIEKNTQENIEKIKNEEYTVSFIFTNRVNNIKYLISTKYIKDQKLWASSYIKYSEIVESFSNKFILYFITYILTMLVIWWLFNYINRIEKNKRAYLEYKAHHDELTKLPNRFYLNENIDTWTKEANSFSLIYVDLDNFKYVNDTFGHIIGDEAIKYTVNNIKNTLEKNDLFVRQSGDEFIILTNNTDNIEEYCQNILHSLDKKIEIQNKEFKISASLGVSNYPNDSKEFTDLMICADIACFNAKKTKNTFKILTKEIKNKYLEKIEIEKELKSALDKNEIYLVYQPQMNYNGSIHGVETLVRWENDKLGFVGPDKFISIAEDCGLMAKLGDYIIDTSLKEISELQAKTNKQFHVSINISVQQFMEKDFYSNLMNKVRKYNVNPTLITLEITESMFIDNIDYLTYLFINLRSEGFTISLDDFGTGYSSLSILRKLPINELKIDKAFVDDITFDESAQHMIKTIISIGKILDFHIVLAEGVETKNQVELLNSYGCDTYQGYFYSKPLVIKKLEDFINSL